MPLMLSPAGRLAPVKKLGWPEVSRAVLNCEYVKKTAALVLTAATAVFWLFSVCPPYDPKPTLNVNVMLFVNVAVRRLMAVCSSRRKLAIWACVNCTPPLLKSLLTRICMTFSKKGPRRGSSSLACALGYCFVLLRCRERGAQLGILRDVPAVARRNEVDDAQTDEELLVSNGEDPGKGAISSRRAFRPAILMQG